MELRSIPRYPYIQVWEDGTIKTTRQDHAVGYLKANRSRNSVKPIHKQYRALMVYDAESKRQKWVYIHKLVLLAFHGEKPSPQHQGRHINGNCQDNRACNLAWGTHTENHADRESHGSVARGEQQRQAKLTEAKVREILLSEESGKVLADRYGVSTRTISRVRNREDWRHVVV